MTRVAWKLPYINRIFFSQRFSQSKYLQLWIRDSVISPFFFNRSFGVINGNYSISMTISNDMIGRKFGEYSITKALGFRETKKNSKKRSSKFKKK